MNHCSEGQRMLLFDAVKRQSLRHQQVISADAALYRYAHADSAGHQHKHGRFPRQHRSRVQGKETDVGHQVVQRPDQYGMKQKLPRLLNGLERLKPFADTLDQFVDAVK